MAIFTNDNKNLTKRDVKFLLGSLAVITTATVLGLYIYNDMFKMHWTKRNSKEYYGQMNPNPNLNLSHTNKQLLY